MSERDLHDILAELHAQLESSNIEDPGLRDELRGTIDELQSTLERSDDQGPLIAAIENLALRFETSHPTIAGVLNQLTHTLSNLGI